MGLGGIWLRGCFCYQRRVICGIGFFSMADAEEAVKESILERGYRLARTQCAKPPERSSSFSPSSKKAFGTRWITALPPRSRS